MMLTPWASCSCLTDARRSTRRRWYNAAWSRRNAQYRVATSYWCWGYHSIYQSSLGKTQYMKQVNEKDLHRLVIDWMIKTGDWVLGRYAMWVGEGWKLMLILLKRLINTQTFCLLLQFTRILIYNLNYFIDYTASIKSLNASLYALNIFLMFRTQPSYSI